MHAKRLYLLEKASLNTVCFLSCRFRFEVFFVRICRRPCFVRMSFPVPVFLKRFRIAFLVFILGTFLLRFTTYECSYQSCNQVFYFFLPIGASTKLKFRPICFGGDSVCAISLSSSAILRATF